MYLSKSLFFQSYLSSFLTFILLILNLFFIKLQINILGLDKYGLLVLLLSVFGTIGLLDMGIGTALVKFYSKNRSIYWAMFFSSFNFMFLFTLVIFFISSFFYKDIFNVVGIREENLTILSFWGLSFIGIARLLSSILLSYWMAKIDFFKLKLFSFINFNFPITIILVLVYLEHSFENSLFFAGTLNLLFIVFIAFYIFFSETSNKEIKLLYNVQKHFRDFIKEAIQFQSLSVINNISNPIINTLININFGLQVVSYFDISLKLLRAARQIIIAYVEPLFGKITELYNRHRMISIKLIILKYTKKLLIASLLYIVGFFFFSKIILTLWVGKEFANKTILMVNILSIGFAINILSTAIYYAFLAIPKYRKYVFYHQTLLFSISVLPFAFLYISVIEYAYMYSSAYIFSSLYLFIVYFVKFKKGKKI